MPGDIIDKKRLILLDGTVLEGCECGYSNRNLWCFLKGVSFGEAFQYFSGPEKFRTVIFEMEFTEVKHRIIYSGFDAITNVQQSEFTVDVCIYGSNIQIKRERIVDGVVEEEGGE